MTGLQLTRRQYYALCTMVLLSPLLHLVPRKTTAEAGCGGWLCALAALVPLTLSAAPFIARMVEQSLEEIDTGVIEAAQCMGATRWQIITRVLLVESVPSLLRGLSISLITILGYTAITGSVGAGGLGNLAFRFGYQRYQKPVMYATVLLLILLVCVIQIIFDFAARKADKRTR